MDCDCLPTFHGVKCASKIKFSPLHSFDSLLFVHGKHSSQFLFVKFTSSLINVYDLILESRIFEKKLFCILTDIDKSISAKRLRRKNVTHFSEDKRAHLLLWCIFRRSVNLRFIFQQHFECRNHIRVIQPMDDGGRLYICGTNAHSPKDIVIYVSFEARNHFRLLLFVNW